jgi:hypothetical protein
VSTIYSELIEAAGTEFLPQAEGEPDGHYLRRLVLAVSKASDSDWERLSKEAQDWYNAQAKRVKAQQDPEECPGFDDSLLSELSRTGTELKCPDYDIITKDLVTVNWPIVTRSQVEAVKNGTSRLEDQDGNAIVDAVVDAGWPTGPELPKASSNDVAHQDSQATVVQEFDTVIKDAFKPYASESKHTATDAVRACVMLHTDWNQSQIAAELEAQCQHVSIGTIATVRSMTLATIAVAKRLGKWVEA